MSNSVSRREFFKYLSVIGGATSLFPLSTLLGLSNAQAADNPIQKFIFVNFADGYPRGHWSPGRNEDGTLSMKACTEALQPIQENCVFINGLDLRGSSGHDGFSNQWRDADRNAPSIDTLLASQNEFRAGYTHPHVRAGVDTNHWGHGSRVPSQRIGNSTLTYNDSFSSLYQSMFGNGVPIAGSLESRKKLIMIEQSLADLSVMQAKYGAAEAPKLNAHRLELETVRQSILNASNTSDNSPEQYLWKTLTSAGGRDARAELQVQNLVLALATGRSRVGCLALGSSNDNVGIPGVADGKAPHETSHKLFGSLIFAETRNWYMKQVYRLAYHLQQINDVNDTSLFDNTLIVVTSEMSEDHSPSDLPVLLIGGRAANGTNNSLIQFGQLGMGRSISNNAPIGTLWSGLADATGIISPYPSSPISNVFA